jgi:tetratricopeptide (TPR) repeat protein
MHVQKWLENLLPHLASRAFLALPLTCMLAHAQSNLAGLPDLISLQEIQHEEFEPAVGEQIRRAYNETLHEPRNAEVVGRLGMILQCYRKYELAEMCYRRAWRLSPGSLRWAYYLGNVEGWTGKNHDAIDHVRKALGIDESYTPARVRLAQLLFESGDLQQSIKEYEESIRQNPRLAAAHLGRGRVLAARGAWSDAIASYRRACNLFENHAASHYALAMAYRKTGDEAKALEEMDLYQRFKKMPQPAEDPLVDAITSLYAGGNTYFANGSSLAQQGMTKQAGAAFELALKVNPRLIMAHVNLIAIYSDLGLPTKAEEHFREAVKLDSGWAEVYYNWGLLLFREGKFAEASETFKKAIEVNPNYANAYVQLGQFLDEGGRMSEAQQHYRLALESSPSNRQARYLLGSSLIRTGQFDEAITQLLETIKIDDGKTPVCMQALAAAYQGAGDTKNAMYYTRQARERAMLRKMDELAAQLQRDIDRLSAETKAQ